MTVRTLRWQRETAGYSSRRHKPSSKHKTRDERGGMQRKPSLLSKGLSTRLMRCDRKLSTRHRVLHPESIPFQTEEIGEFAKTKKPHTLLCCVRTLLNRGPSAARLHLANVPGCTFGCVGDSDCGVQTCRDSNCSFRLA